MGDDWTKWRVKAKGFDNDTDAGKLLNQDLARLQAKQGQDHILFELLFPDDYPSLPFFLRVVSPRYVGCVVLPSGVTSCGLLSCSRDCGAPTLAG